MQYREFLRILDQNDCRTSKAGENHVMDYPNNALSINKAQLVISRKPDGEVLLEGRFECSEEDLVKAIKK